ncbi:MAG: ribosome assembly cofactor RimP [Bacteroidetes bacterium]|nr:ribosome assembly cofactor RimP [Bacteroidota bacterium]
MISKDHIETLLFQKLGGTECFTVDVSVGNNNRITVIVDSDKGITVEQCAEINRYLEQNLDRNIEDFSIEVSSPGIGNPFKVFRQQQKSIGRDVSVLLADGRRIMGRMLAASPALIEIETGNGKIEFIGGPDIKEIKEVLPF